jgi:hypothetical protein
MAAKPRKGGRGAEQNRALRMLAGSPLGCTEAIMLAHGFTVETLGRLVLDGHATAPLRQCDGRSSSDTGQRRICRDERRPLGPGAITGTIYGASVGMMERVK